MECTEEYIPGYGFILNPELEARALEILENYGFFPYVGESTENRTPASLDEWRAEFAIAWPDAKKIDYELRDEADEASAQATMDSTKYGSVYQKLSTFDLVKVLRYAKTVGTPLAAKIMDKTKRNAKLEEKMFYVHRSTLQNPRRWSKSRKAARKKSSRSIFPLFKKSRF